MLINKRKKAVLKTKEKICIYTFITLQIIGQTRNAQYWDDSGKKKFGCKTQL